MRCSGRPRDFRPADKARRSPRSQARKETRVSKKFLTDAIGRSTAVPAVAANRPPADIINAIKGKIIGTGRFTLPDFGAFVVRETPKRTALNPRTGETGR